jgi:hypothetical protein
VLRQKKSGTELKSEEVMIGFSFTDFFKLVHSRSVEGRIGATEFTVKEGDLEKWRRFADGMR